MTTLVLNFLTHVASNDFHPASINTAAKPPIKTPIAPMKIAEKKPMTNIAGPIIDACSTAYTSFTDCVSHVPQ